MAKAPFNMETPSTGKLDFTARKKVLNCYVMSIALYGAETWTLLKVDQKYLGSFEILCRRRM